MKTQQHDGNFRAGYMRGERPSPVAAPPRARTILRRHCFGLLAAPALGQSYLSSPRRALTAPELREAPEEWIDRSLRWVNDMLDQHRPSVPEHPVRRAALIRLDDILHIEAAPAQKLLQDWLRARMDNAAQEIEAARVSQGARIWKLYNHTFFIKTASSAFVYDLVPGPPKIPAMAMTPAALEKIVRAADALFVSHWHDDHANAAVGEMFFAQNKPVLGPPDIWRDKPELRAKLISPERSTTKLHRAGRLEYFALPGHQGEPITNNCNLVKTPEGFTFLQTGDQSNESDFAWIDEIHRSKSVDVLFPNCWTPQPLRLVAGVKPRLIVPGHENEMAHTVPHREDWTQTYNRFHGAAAPLLVLGWGESYLYNRA